MSNLKLRLIGAAFILLSFVALKPADADRRCPQRHFNGICIQVITFAQSPGSDFCCEFANPCVVPPGWVPCEGEPI
jgi:hypothetical protein